MRIPKGVFWFLVMIAAGATAYGAVLWRRGFSTQDSPTTIEATLARAARNQAIPAEAKNAVNPYQPTTDRLTLAGKQFLDRCAICHGKDGGSATEIGQNLYPQAPDMRLVGTQQLTDGELFYIIRNGVRFTGMPGWAGALTREDTWNLVLFIRRLPQGATRELQAGGDPRR